MAQVQLLLRCGHGLFAAGYDRHPKIFNQCAERLRNRPGLSRTASRMMWRISVENFEHLPEAGFP